MRRPSEYKTLLRSPEVRLHSVVDLAAAGLDGYAIEITDIGDDWGDYYLEFSLIQSRPAEEYQAEMQAFRIWREEEKAKQAAVIKEREVAEAAKREKRDRFEYERLKAKYE